MLCSICGENESIITISFTVSNETQSIYVCEDCMNRFGLSIDKINDFVASVLEDMQEEDLDKNKGIFAFQRLLDVITNNKSLENDFQNDGSQKSVEKNCPVCKSTEKDIISAGYFKCYACFETFKNVLLHKAHMFQGNIPKTYRLMWLDEKFKLYLKGRLDVAVIKEDFEKASQIKKIIDKITK